METEYIRVYDREGNLEEASSECFCTVKRTVRADVTYFPPVRGYPGYYKTIIEIKIQKGCAGYDADAGGSSKDPAKNPHCWTTPNTEATNEKGHFKKSFGSHDKTQCNGTAAEGSEEPPTAQPCTCNPGGHATETKIYKDVHKEKAYDDPDLDGWAKDLIDEQSKGRVAQAINDWQDENASESGPYDENGHPVCPTSVPDGQGGTKCE
tara:strand:+ start:62 stop:685 length:624 start_codon:yes stop_codon:yes gene_type:complete